MKSINKMTNAELAAFIESHLRERGIDLVLSGGACVSIYSNGKYVSMDLDLVNIYLEKRSKIRKAMEGIGFSEEGRHFIHPDADYLVEFPAGPLSVGEEPVKKVDEHKLATGVLRIISPTDCVKDRLAAYYHWNDAQSLEQAILVTRDNIIDIKEIRRWSEVEGKLVEFKHCKDRLTKNEP